MCWASSQSGLFGSGSNVRANGAKRRSGRKPGARVTNFALAEFKVVAHGSLGSKIGMS